MIGKRLRSGKIVNISSGEGRVKTADQMYRNLVDSLPDLSEGIPATIAADAIDSVQQPPTGVGIPNTVFINLKGIAERVPAKHSVLIDARALSEGMPVLVKLRKDGFLWIRDLNLSEADRAFQSTSPQPNFALQNHDHESNSGGGTLDAAAIASGALLLERGGTEADLSATGGTGQFLKQSSAGAVVTVGTIGSADITSALTTPPAIGGTTPAAGKFSTLENTGAYVHNEAGGNVDARWEGDTDANLLMLDASADNLGVGTGTPNAAAKIHVVSTSKGTVVYPVMTTAQRTAIGTPIEGLGVYDSDENALYLHDGSNWVEVGSGGGAGAFTDLTDVPASYTGEAGKVLAVNGGETGLEFVTVGGGTPLSVTKTSLKVEVPLHDETLGSSGAFDVSSISGAYQDLRGRLYLRGTVSATTDVLLCWFNNDTTTGNYHTQSVRAGNGSATIGENPSSVSATIAGATAPSDEWTEIEFTIYDYAGAKYKHIEIRASAMGASADITAGTMFTVWKSTAAITRIMFRTDNHATDLFATGSRMQLWGITEMDVVTDTTGGSGVLEVSTANISTPPTAAELDTAFGTPATVGTGFHAAVNDNAAGTAVYLVMSDGSNWWHVAMTKAT